MIGWTDERVDTLKVLYAEGLSISQIAARLGSGLSRNAVIGKVRRLGLTKNHRQKPTPPGPMRTRPAVKWTKAAPPPHKMVEPDFTPKPRVRTAHSTVEASPDIPIPALRVVETDHPPIALLDRPANGCCYPVSGEGADMMVCGADRARGAYCARHGAIAYTGVPTKPVTAPKEYQRQQGMTPARKSAGRE